MRKETTSLNPQYVVYGKGSALKDEKLPLVIYLHGSGGTGDQIRKVARQPHALLQTIQKMGKKCLCVAPQALKSPREHGGWLPKDLDILIVHLKETLPIDTKRIYLTGTSMGGYGTYSWAGNSPEHFAAIAPMVGGIGPAGPKDITKDLEKWGKNLAQIPMMAYYVENDKVVPANRGATILTAIEKAGGTKAEVIVLKDQGHAAARVPYRDIEFVQWLFSQKKK